MTSFKSPGINVFQSTLSIRRATRSSFEVPDDAEISIHALRKESDRHDHAPRYAF